MHRGLEMLLVLVFREVFRFFLAIKKFYLIFLKVGSSIVRVLMRQPCLKEIRLILGMVNGCPIIMILENMMLICLWRDIILSM